MLVISSLQAGGAERVMSKMANYWAADGKEIAMVTVACPESDFYQCDSRITRIGLSLRRRWPGLLGVVEHCWRIVVSLRREARAFQPQIVISFGEITNILTLLAMRRIRRPVIISERVNPAAYPIGFSWSALRRWSYPTAQALVVQTPAVAEWAARHLPRERVYCIPNPVEPVRLPPAGDLTPASSATRCVLGMGRLAPQKGFDLLIKAFARCAKSFPAWQLVILGEGPERANLQQLISELGLKDCVSLRGIEKDPCSILSAGHLFVLSSRFEGFPNALCEAMACGLPVISYDCPSGPREIIREGVDGLLVPEQDVEHLAQAMGLLMSDERRRSEFGERAKEIVQRFSAGQVMNQWNEVIERALTTRR